MGCNSTLPQGKTRIRARAVLCDIDATIIDVVPSLPGGDFREHVFQVLSGHIAERMRIAESAARETLDGFADNLHVWWDYPDFITHFRLDATRVWEDLRRVHERVLLVYEDAVRMVRELSKTAVDLHIVSNNPVTGCLMKLERAGLARLDGTDHFKRVFGTNVTRGMKNQTRLWRLVLDSLNVDPTEVVVVGDSLKEDCEAPSRAGIENAIIVDRTLDHDVLETEDCVRVRSLVSVKDLVEPI